VAAQAFQRGLLVNAPRQDTLRFMPALTVTHEEIDRMIDILDAVLEQIVP
jgi:acetylornithine/N-succinyldiaminopimelate aminotransferase